VLQPAGSGNAVIDDFNAEIFPAICQSIPKDHPGLCLLEIYLPDGCPGSLRENTHPDIQRAAGVPFTLPLF